MKSIIKFNLIAMLLTCSTCFVSQMYAQESDATIDSLASKPISLSGSVDAYYRLNLNQDFDASPGTSFANLPGFSLGMANIILSKEGEKVGFTSDFVFGPRGEDAVFASPLYQNLKGGAGGSSQIVNQLYVYWNINSSVKATIGNFNTFLGYEVISPTSNFNYSTSYLFSYGPFSHSGLKIDVDLGNGFSAMGSLLNPTDFTEFNPTNDYATGWQLGYSNDELSVFLNAVVSEDFYQFDITAGMDLTEKVYFGLNASKLSENSNSDGGASTSFGFMGVASYLQYNYDETLGFGVRGEYFLDEGYGILATDESVVDLTLSANYKIGELTIIPEFRIDIFSTELIPNEGSFEDSLSSFVLAAIYGF